VLVFKSSKSYHSLRIERPELLRALGVLVHRGVVERREAARGVLEVEVGAAGCVIGLKLG
jgi:hypothetical protein